MTSWSNASMGPAMLRRDRRRFLAGTAAVAGAAAIGFPALRARAAGTLKDGTYGGYFKDSFDEHIFPAITEETGSTSPGRTAPAMAKPSIAETSRDGTSPVAATDRASTRPRAPRLGIATGSSGAR